MAKWTPAEFTQPDASDPHRIREFIRAKYVMKRWHNPNAAENQAERESRPATAASAAPANQFDIFGANAAVR